MACHGCGVSVSEGDEHCPRCGREIEHDLMCPNCDEKLDDPDSCDLCRWESGDDLSEPITGSDHLRSDPTLSPNIRALLGGAPQVDYRTSAAQDQGSLWRSLWPKNIEPDPEFPWWYWVILLAIVIALLAVVRLTGG